MTPCGVVGIRFVVEFVLDREEIVVARYAGRPMRGFSLRDESTLGGRLVRSLTLARVWDGDGSRRRDTVAFRLATPKDAGRFAGGDEVLLEDVEACGFLPDRALPCGDGDPAHGST